MTAAEAAEEIGISESTLRRYVQDGAPCDRLGRGKPNMFDAGEVVAWMRENGLSGKVGRPSEGDSPDLDAARLRKENALASKYELQVEKERGLLIDRAEVEQASARKVVAVRNKLMACGASLAPRLVGLTAAEIQETIDDYHRDICDEFARSVD